MTDKTDAKQKQTDPMPRYMQIAIEIALKVANEEYSVGQRVFGRSSVAGQYKVSPETARRAFCVLSEFDIVSSEKGSGMYIKSRENAVAFLNQLPERRTLETIKNDIISTIEAQESSLAALGQLTKELVTATERFRSMNPLSPFSIRITAECRFLDKTINEIKLWQHTGATLVALKRNGTLLRSPGPYATLLENDVVYFISQEDTDQKVRSYLY
ncbi:MAG: TrkA C-terminal domain-containing protein [Spirochaetia bacterium]|jgi:K+/H+ antiporter YhaU regulatory subunit KhtT|nr:TrkA C-terminal domain-containing protein [Spirochaetia bacterium]